MNKRFNPNSIVHKMNPIIKFGLFISTIASAFTPIGLIGFAAINGFSIVMFIMARGTWRAIKPILFSATFTFLILMVINWYVVQPDSIKTIMFYIGDIPVYTESMVVTGKIVLRLTSILLMGSVYTQTTSNRDLARVFEIVFYPLMIIRIPTHKLSMIMSLSLRFMPELINNFKEIINAQASRGVDIKSWNIREKTTALKNSFTPMFVLMFKKSETISASMDMRDFDKKTKRTKFNKLSLIWWDIIPFFMLGGLISTIVLLSLM